MLTVYLDTSDYAHMYRARPDSELARTRDRLLHLVATEQIAVGISFFVMFELLQDSSSAYLEDRLDRARLVKQMCRSNAFPFVSDMFNGDGFSTEGIWFPRDTLKEFSVERMARTIYERLRAEPRLNRKLRRKLSNPSNFREILRADARLFDISTQDLSDFPLSDEFIDRQYLRRYLLGEISAEEANSVLSKSLTDPVLLFQLWQKYATVKNPLKEMLSGHFEKLKTVVDKWSSALQEMKSLKQNYARARRDYQKSLAKLDLPRELKAGLPAVGPKLSELKLDLHMSPEMLVSKGVSAEWAEVVSAYLNSRISGAKLQSSDLGDLAHALYLPMCDLWRSDRSFANTLLSANVPHAGRIVPTLRELPDRIEGLQKRAQMARP